MKSAYTSNIQSRISLRRQRCIYSIIKTELKKNKGLWSLKIFNLFYFFFVCHVFLVTHWAVKSGKFHQIIVFGIKPISLHHPIGSINNQLHYRVIAITVGTCTTLKKHEPAM